MENARPVDGGTAAAQSAGVRTSPRTPRPRANLGHRGTENRAKQLFGKSGKLTVLYRSAHRRRRPTTAETTPTTADQFRTHDFLVARADRMPCGAPVCFGHGFALSLTEPCRQNVPRSPGRWPSSRKREPH